MSTALPKLCIVSVSLANGGAERSAAVLSRMLIHLGYEVHLAILTNQIDYEYAGKLYNLGVEKESTNHPIARFKRFKKFKQYLQDEQIKIVIDHRPKNNYYREIFYAKYLYKGISRIYVVHSSNLSTYFAKPAAKMLKLYNSNFHTVGVSEMITEHLLHKKGVKNASTIPNAFSKSWKFSDLNMPSEIQKIKKFILFYGRINDEVKDIKFLLNAFTSSKIWEKEVHLVIMGDGPDKANLVTHSYRLPSTKYIHFIPYQSRPFMLIEKARLVALTSKYEGFPMVLIESLAMGTPVVSLDFVSGPSEVIQHRKNGLLVEKRSELDFASALEEMCFNDQLYETCKVNASESVEAFSETEIAKKWDSLLRSFSK
jgi:glycosyltransferase involved in cell wall biosynthesis